MPLEILARPRYAATLLLVLAILQTVYNAGLPLHGDEAYYWVWSRHPALSYFDHPPMIAWLLALTTLPVVSEWSVRLVPVLCLSLATWLIYRLAREVYGKHAAAVALLMFTVLPITQMGTLVATPDAPVILFWTLALFAAYRAVFDGGTVWFMTAGAAIGLALLSKYTAVLFPASLLAFLLLRRPGLLLQGRAWLALLTALLVFSPVVIWNWQHDWISFGFQYAHGEGDGAIRWRGWFEFIGGSFMAYSPVLFAVALAAALNFRRLRDERQLFLAIFFLLPMTFFLYKGLYKGMGLHWVAVAYPSLTVLAAGLIAERRLWKTLAVGLAVAVLLSLLIKFPATMGLPPKLNIQQRLAGYREACLEMVKLRQPGEVLYADHLTTASLLSFYAPDHPDVRIPTPTRFSQYDLWGLNAIPHPPAGLYLSMEDHDADLARVFGRVDLLAVMPVKDLDKRFKLYRCRP